MRLTRLTFKDYFYQGIHMKHHMTSSLKKSCHVAQSHVITDIYSTAPPSSEEFVDLGLKVDGSGVTSPDDLASLVDQGAVWDTGDTP